MTAQATTLAQEAVAPTIDPVDESPASIADQGRMARLHQAVHLFRKREYPDVLEVIEAEPDGGGEVGRALRLTARAMILDGRGRSEEAGPLMEEALALIIPVPEVLEAIATFFARQDRPLLAHHAFLMADVCRPMSLARFEAAQEGPERVRYAPWALRGSGMARRQDLYGLAVRKAELRERLGPEGAGMAVAAMIDPPGSRRARVRPLRTLYDHAREHGREFEEMPAARTVTYAAPNVRDGERGAPVERATRPYFRCALEDVLVSAKSSTLLTADVAIIDLPAPSIVFDADPILAGGDPTAVVVAEPARPDRLREVPEALWLSGMDSRSFGDWIVEYLPRVWTFIDRPGFQDLPVIIDDGMPAQMEESLRFFIGPTNPLIRLGRDECVRVGTLWVASQLFDGETVDVDAWLALVDRARPALERVDTTGVPERIYLTRKSIQHRRLTNAEEIEELAVRRGYTVIDFAEVPFAEQVRLIRGARHVVGPDGSAFLMTFLGRPGLRIGKLSQPFIEEVEGYAHVSEAMGQDLTVLVGELEAPHPRFRRMSDYRIDPARLAGYLDDVDRMLGRE